MRRNGFTLVELLIVVTIIGVLAVVAGTAYRKYSDSGRTAEVYAMFGEFRAKEEAYRAETSRYVTTTAVGETDYYPALLATGLEPKAKFWGPPNATPPASWTTLGINPGKTQLYCGYVAVSGPAGSWGAFAGPMGEKFRNSGAIGPPPATPWWYVNASCDNDGNATTNATFTTASSSTTVYSANEHK